MKSLFQITILLFLIGTLTACGNAFKFQEPMLVDDIDMSGKTMIGDMIVDEDQLEVDYTDGGEVSAQAATLNLYKRKHTKWKDGIVPYKFHSSAGKKLKKKFKEAASRWSEGTGIQFVKKDRERVFLLIRSDSSGCFASLGAPRDPGPGKKAKAIINIQPGGCNKVGIIMHEIGHVLGMIHEHQRVDRGKYVQVLWENITESGKDNFKKIKQSTIHSEYDFASIMHYAKDNHSKNGKRTLKVKKPYKDEWNKKLGDPVLKHAKLSENDKAAIKSFYKLD